MRTYYLFKISDELKSMYNKKSNNIYKLLNSIRLSDIKDKDRVNKLYKRITKTINKKLINDYIIRNHLNDFYYKKIGIYHELSNEVENSILIVNNTYIKIVTNNNISSFFKDLYSINDNYFLIDFDNKDYFYLDDLKTKITCL